MREPNPETAQQAEATVCAAALFVAGFFEAILRLPEPEDFDDVKLGELWTAILDARERGPVTRLAVQRALIELQWDEKAAFAAVARADASYLTLPEAERAVEELLTRRLRRRAARICGETLKELESAVDVEAVVQRHERAIIDVASRADGADGWMKSEDIREEHLDRIETGIEPFDRVNGGLASGVLTIIAARPGMGKTALAVALMRNMAKRHLGVGCNSLEMPALDLWHRMAAAEAYDTRQFDPDDLHGGWNPTYSDYERRMLHGETLERFESAKAAIKRLPIRWDDKQGRTIGQIRMGGRRLKTAFGREAIDLRLLVVDHLGKIHAEGRHTNRNTELGEISDGLMQLAAELRIPVVALCQLSRDVEKRPDKRPQISDLRESGRLEEDAHTVILLYRQAYYDALARERDEDLPDEAAADRQKYDLEINTVKFRGGTQRRVTVFCDIARNVVLDPIFARGHLARSGRKQEDMFV